MSLNRENIIWRSGSDWYIGFFDCSVWGEDYEWDVHYDFSSFQWASGPHSSREEAQDAWHGANPGSHTTETDPSAAKVYDQMFQDYQEARRRLWSERF